MFSTERTSKTLSRGSLCKPRISADITLLGFHLFYLEPARDSHSGEMSVSLKLDLSLLLPANTGAGTGSNSNSGGQNNSNKQGAASSSSSHATPVKLPLHLRQTQAGSQSAREGMAAKRRHAARNPGYTLHDNSNADDSTILYTDDAEASNETSDSSTPPRGIRRSFAPPSAAGKGYANV